MAGIEVVEYTDPTCSWAWGGEPKIRRLAWCYGEDLSWRRVMGGLLAPEWPSRELGVTDPTYLTNPEFLTRSMRYHSVVTETTGMPFPGRLERLPESSYAACGAVIAAEGQGAELAGRLLRRYREDWYVFGVPPGTRAEALASAAHVAGLDVDALSGDLDDRATEAAWQSAWEETRNPHEFVLNLEDRTVGYGSAQPQRGRMRYGFPTLILRGPAGEAVVPGWRPWDAYEDALRVAAGGLPAARPLPTPDEALDHYGLMAGPEFDLLCGPEAKRPSDAVAFDAGGGTVWMSPAEAATRREHALT